MARPRDAGRLRYRLSAGSPFGALCRHRAGAQRPSHRLCALARARARPVERPQAVPPLRALRRRPLRQRRLRAARAGRQLRRLGIGFRAGGAAGEQRRAPRGQRLALAAGRIPRHMKFLFDLLPVVLFFAAFKAWDIYVATAVAIAATFVQVGWLKLTGRRVEPMLWASLGIIAVFGGATLLLQDETFIKWKPTVLYWSWIGFFAFMGAANLYVAYNYSTDLWVNFKLFGGMGLMLVFVVVQALFLARYVEEKQ